jgi:hypothetical protein
MLCLVTGIYKAAALARLLPCPGRRPSGRRCGWPSTAVTSPAPWA